ncbi:exopolyphosphatase / guanosine-5'-triphosphate,3'-diphosphate pyrophosphatase [Lentzea xinjiangensis]|uniref:Exopolyphosphatase / guanosine-5'-triphosphate,3'-diphosphate pyrophosphatase n=1 Tax=Lentzea xinjiangensis TaxID=402600 RepID=A0A1H9QIE8_9PSEU|nr:exopolyphosphatase [Lentzea xinjiangensis]SER60224.1 exopolyphosphatase / guanosine-5'-triphosphate,3'-diphosphate pyrophosphatase [Lentzea xinjiangensis]
MSVGVLDVGCFSAHLVVVDRDLLRPLLSHKVRLRLDRELGPDGAISAGGIDSLCAAVLAARKKAGDVPFLPFATSSVRDCTNADEVMRKVARRTGVELKVLSGKEEARLSYTAARHWFGWGAGPMVVLDVGGGTVELASGTGAEPEVAVSLPLGARTLTRAGLTVQDMRAVVRERLAAFPRNETARAVGCSKVFEQLARLAGARPDIYAQRQLKLKDLEKWIPRLAKLSVRERAALPGISRHRAQQSLAGAVVAEGLMQASGHDVVDISPWSTKEGLLLDLVERARGRRNSAA